MKSSMFTLFTYRMLPTAMLPAVVLATAIMVMGMPIQALAQAVSVPVTPSKSIAPVVQPLAPQPIKQPSTQTQTGAGSQPNSVLDVPTTTGGAIDQASRAEILATFQREARAAYAEAKTACQDLPKDQQAVCLAKARIQFDQDMQYAQKRADMGF